MLEAKLQDKRYDLNGLKGEIRKFGQYYVLYELARGKAPSWMLAENPLDDFIDVILDSGKSSAVNAEETEWLENLQGFRSEIRGFNAEKYLSMSQDERARYSSIQGIKFTELLKPLVKGYIDRKDSFCPACPDAKPGVTWESWEYHLNPRRFFDMCNRMIFPRNDQGVGVCPDIIKEEE